MNWHDNTIFFSFGLSEKSGNFHDIITPGGRVGGWLDGTGICGCPQRAWEVNRKTEDAWVTRVWADTGGNHVCETTFPSPPPLPFLSVPISTPWHGQCPPPPSRCPASGSCEEHEGGLHEHTVPFGWFGPVVWKHLVLNSMLFIKFHDLSGRVWRGGENQTFSWFNLTFSNLRNFYSFTRDKKIAPPFCFTTSIGVCIVLIN